VIHPLVPESYREIFQIKIRATAFSSFHAPFTPVAAISFGRSPQRSAFCIHWQSGQLTHLSPNARGENNQQTDVDHHPSVTLPTGKLLQKKFTFFKTQKVTQLRISRTPKIQANDRTRFAGF
jgi:hypothetical protein